MMLSKVKWWVTNFSGVIMPWATSLCSIGVVVALTRPVVIARSLIHRSCSFSSTDTRGRRRSPPSRRRRRARRPSGRSPARPRSRRPRLARRSWRALVREAPYSPAVIIDDVAGLDATVAHPNLEAGGQDVRGRGLRLGAVDEVAEDPADARGALVGEALRGQLPVAVGA